MPDQPLLAIDANVDLSAVAIRDLVRLLHLMSFGEQIATECAQWQSLAAEDPRDRRFFKAQARHERFHARLFQSVAHVLIPDVALPRHLFNVMSDYRWLLDMAIRRRDWLQVLIGQQLVLENLGEVVLYHLDDNMTRRRLGLSPLRKLIIRQEQAHHCYGLRLLDAAMKTGRADRATLHRLASPYLELTDGLLTVASPLLESLDADAEEYRQEFWANLPDWAQ